ncbi:MAG: hypothetical protein AB7S38_37805 [Vulcanimicrobiota bacterium]
MRVLAICLLLSTLALAHTVNHEVTQAEAVVVTVQLGDEEASYSEYEVFPPGGAEGNPFAIGRTDFHGRVVFVPDQPGQWTVKVKADSTHGLHGATVEVEVDEHQVVKSFSQPLVATHTRLLVGISVLFGIFGGLSLLRGRRSSSD